MAKIKYKVNGYWREIIVEGYIEAIAYDNESLNEPPFVLKVNVNDGIATETGLV